MELLWERMSVGTIAKDHPSHSGSGNSNGNGANGHAVRRPVVRLPGDTRCLARRKDGVRCKGRIRPGSEFCIFHDPAFPPEQRREAASRGGKTGRRRVQLPKGYPRRLDSAAAVQRAMDRLYGEIRLGVIDAQTGQTLLELLCRLAKLHGIDISASRTEGEPTKP